MLALYRSGRQAEALEAFQAARRLLVDELGLEPSGELQELERAILRQDESLRAPPRVEPSPAVEATIPPPAVRATRKTVTIAVFEPATELAERLDPELARTVLDRCLAGVRAAVSQHGGTVAEAADAAVVSVFGVPATHEDDALRAVRATVDARAAVAGLNDELPAGRGAFLETRAGISTGEVLVAGSALPTGRPVGHARTLAREARAGEIVLDASTQTLLRDTVELEGRPDGSFRVVGMPATADARSLRLDAPLVGRRRQLAALLAAFEAAEEEGSCRLFSVLGVAGVGKSRLVGELLTELDGRAHVRRGRCLSYGEAITYLPLQEALPDADVDWAAPKDVLARRLREEFETLARERPVALALDDLHWAEPGLLDLLEDIGATSRGVPLLLVCAARPELLDDRPTWGGGVANASSLLLEPLPEADTERLLDLLLGASDLPDPVRTYIVAASEGNPLFLEELLASLVEAEVLQRRSGRWTTTEIAIPVLAGITALIAARIDRLPQDDRHLLELASVEGVVFSRDVLAEVVPDALRPDLAVRLDTLVRRELVRPIGGGGFRFRHQLIREAAYSALTKHDRGDLHERLASVLEAEAAAPELVAYHREEAGRYRAELGLD